jgi:DNA-binding NarL/FixJ family response regulator
MAITTCPAFEATQQGLRGLTCVIADDHRAIVEFLARALKARGVKVIGRVCDGTHALARIEVSHPDLAILDVRMPGLSGVEIARRIASSSPETATLLYTGFADQALLLEALDVGARGFVYKEASVHELLRAIEIVASGGSYIDPVVGSLLAGSQVNGRLRELSKREREVLRLVADGNANAEIGRRLGIAPRTVNDDLHSAMSKLDAETRTHAVASAIRQALIA